MCARARNGQTVRCVKELNGVVQHTSYAPACYELMRVPINRQTAGARALAMPSTSIGVICVFFLGKAYANSCLETGSRFVRARTRTRTRTHVIDAFSSSLSLGLRQQHTTAVMRFSCAMLGWDSGTGCSVQCQRALGRGVIIGLFMIGMMA